MPFVQFILVLCLGSVVCLTPLAAYLLWLCTLTRRTRPTIVSGTWDFAGLLIGLSGFVYFGGGLALSLLRSNVRYLFRGNFEALRESWELEKKTWALFVAAYLLVVLFGAVYGFMRRRRSLVIYNVVPLLFEQTLGEIFEQMGRKVERRGNAWFADGPVLELDPNLAGHTVTLRWVSPDLLFFQEVERHLRQTLPSLSVGENPAIRWFTSATIGAVILVVVSWALLLFGLSLVRA